MKKNRKRKTPQKPLHTVPEALLPRIFWFSLFGKVICSKFVYNFFEKTIFLVKQRLPAGGGWNTPSLLAAQVPVSAAADPIPVCVPTSM